MKKYVLSTAVCAICLYAAFPLHAQGQGERYTVTASSLNLRAAPDRKSNTVELINRGDAVTLVENSNIYQVIDSLGAPWLKVRTANNKTGYAFGGYLKYAGSGDNPAFAYAPKIFIVLNGGSKRTLSDSKNGVTYRFVAFKPEIDFSAVDATTGGEGHKILFVNMQTGSITEFWRMPVPSPSGKKLCAASLDLVAGFDENGLQVYRVVKGSLAREFEMKLEGWGPSDARWTDEDSIEMIKNTKLKECNPDCYKQSKIKLIFKGGNWGFKE